jgi:hypothetical protein
VNKIFEELPFIFGFMAFSGIVSYLAMKYATGAILKIIRALAVIGIIIHELCHLLMCIITHSPVEDVTLIKKIKSEKSEGATYYGHINVSKYRISFMQAFLISFAPLYLSFWLFFLLLNFLINNQFNPLVGFLCLITMISLVLSAAPSFTDLKMIPKAFQNDTNHSYYQIFLIIISILTTWIIVFSFNFQFIHEIFIYLIIVGFYFIFKYGFKFVLRIIQLFYRNSTDNYHRPKKIRIKRETRHHYKPKKYD